MSELETQARDRSDNQAGVAQIEVTPEMIVAAEKVFADWKSENYGPLVELGGLGDVADLLARFSAIIENSSRSASVIPRSS